MISTDDLHILCLSQTRELIEQNIEREHTAVALDKSLCHSALVASQVKYLQRARTKLPSFYAARCIIPDRAFEQSSSEAAAVTKRIKGESVLELTCGLGVDAFALSKRFDRVVTLECNEELAEVARENFRRLGADNIEVVTSRAEEYLARCREQFDWIYADPDRRSDDGRKVVVLEECSPNMLALRGAIARVSARVAIKCSPMFDVDEAFRLYPGSMVEILSVADECKELVIYTPGADGREMIGATAVGRGEVWVDRAAGSAPHTPHFNPESYTHLLIPDVALQKGRIARRLLAEVCDIWSDNGYGLIDEARVANIEKNRHIARVEQIEWIGAYDTKPLRRILAERGIDRAQIMKRDFPHSVERITKQLKIREGGVRRVVFTTVASRQIAIILKE
ncbi:MAG: methyltransferase domain-containing protein [Rikenellaceae bacterium]